MKPSRATGMIGQSSGRGTWWCPSVTHITTSVFSSERSCAWNCGQARAARVLVRVVAGGEPLAGWYAVNQTWCCVNAARFVSGEPGRANGSVTSPGISR